MPIIPSKCRPGAAGRMRKCAAKCSTRSPPGSTALLFEHDLFGKPASTFPDHALKPQRKRDEADHADDHPPPNEQRETVARHIAKKRLHNEPRGDEGDDEADGDERKI